MLATLDLGQLAEVVWVSLLAGLGATTAYSLVVLGTARCAAARRDGRGGAAVGYLSLAVVAGAVFAVGVVVGVDIMLSKS